MQQAQPQANPFAKKRQASEMTPNLSKQRVTHTTESQDVEMEDANKQELKEQESQMNHNNQQDDVSMATDNFQSAIDDSRVLSENKKAL